MNEKHAMEQFTSPDVQTFDTTLKVPTSQYYYAYGLYKDKETGKD